MAMENPTALPIRESILAEAMLPQSGEVVLTGGEVLQLVPTDIPHYTNDTQNHRDANTRVVAQSQRRAYFSEGNVFVVAVIETLEDRSQKKTRDQLWHVIGQGTNPRFKEASMGDDLIRVDDKGIPVLDFVYDASPLSVEAYEKLSALVTEDLRPHMYTVRRILTNKLETTGMVEVIK